MEHPSERNREWRFLAMAPANVSASERTKREATPRLKKSYTLSPFTTAIGIAS